MSGGASSADASARVVDDEEQSDHGDADEDPNVRLRLDERFAASEPHSAINDDERQRAGHEETGADLQGFDHAQRSTSPNTMSSEPRIALTSASMCLRHMKSIA